jgi:hypothetical protein
VFAIRFNLTAASNLLGADRRLTLGRTELQRRVAGSSRSSRETILIEADLHATSSTRSILSVVCSGAGGVENSRLGLIVPVRPIASRAPPRLSRVCRMEGPRADRSQQDRPQSRVPHGPLALAVMVVFMCASIAWGLATLDCPTGKDRWGACKPRAPALRKETTEFIGRLFMRP